MEVKEATSVNTVEPEGQRALCRAKSNYTHLGHKGNTYCRYKNNVRKSGLD